MTGARLPVGGRHELGHEHGGLHQPRLPALRRPRPSVLLENILKYGLLVPIPRPALPIIDAATAIGPQSMSWHESFWRWCAP